MANDKLIDNVDAQFFGCKGFLVAPKGDPEEA